MTLDLINDIKTTLRRARPLLGKGFETEEVEAVCTTLMQIMDEEPLISDLQVWTLKTSCATQVTNALLPLGISNEALLEVLNMVFDEIDDVARSAFDRHTEFSEPRPEDLEVEFSNSEPEDLGLDQVTAT